MLYVDYFGETLKDVETNIPNVFSDLFSDDWMEDYRVRMLIKGIDNSEVVAPHVMENPYFGTHSHLQLSTGCKCAILCLKTDLNLDGDRMGDNCYPWVHMYSLNKDIYLTRESIVPVTNGLPISIMNNGKVYFNRMEFAMDSAVIVEDRLREHWSKYGKG